MSGDTLHVSCAAEGPYVAYSGALIHSLLAHRGRLALHVHFLHGPRLDQRDAERLTALVEGHGAALTLHEVADEQVPDLPSDRYTVAMWHRLFLPELLPHVPRVLYLDVDTLACGSLEPLWRTDLDGHWLAAVTNAFMPNHRWRPGQLGLPSREVYFNSGVLLMDLDAMRRHDATGRLLRVIADRGADFEWPDQDALNLVMGEHRLRLHPRWNATNALSRSWSRGTYRPTAHVRALLRPRIRHFEGPGPNKPWDPACTERQRDRWWEHLRATPWGAELRREPSPAA